MCSGAQSKVVSQWETKGYGVFTPLTTYEQFPTVLIAYAASFGWPWLNTWDYQDLNLDPYLVIISQVLDPPYIYFFRYKAHRAQLWINKALTGQEYNNADKQLKSNKENNK
jgi:hypothetical protein